MGRNVVQVIQYVTFLISYLYRGFGPLHHPQKGHTPRIARLVLSILFGAIPKKTGEELWCIFLFLKKGPHKKRSDQILLVTLGCPPSQ